jgi:DNA-binding CsgD family transcriptional regulator
MDTRAKYDGGELALAEEVATPVAARARGGVRPRAEMRCAPARAAGPQAARLGPARAAARQAAASGAEMNLAAQLMAIEEPEEQIRMLRALLHVTGFHSLAYARVGVQGTAQLEAQAWSLDDTAPHHFGSAYIEGGYGAYDPRLAAVCTSSSPLVWDIDWLLRAWRRDGTPGAMRGLFPALEREAVQSGVMFGIPTLEGGVRAVVSLAAGRPSADWIVENVLVQALTFGLSLHRFAAARRREALAESAPDAARHEPLTEIQAGILSCLAGGLSDKQIAARLQTTPHNVDYHLRLLRRRYGAANRTHLAFLLGGMERE